MISGTIQFRQFAENDSIGELTDLLHRAYADHAKAGRRFFASHQSAEDTRRRMNGAECWLAINGKSIVGTVTCLYPYHPRPGFPAVNNAGTFSQLGITPEFRGKGLGNKLLKLAEDRFIALGADEIVIDTASSATELIAWYNRHDYQEIGTWQWNVTNYPSLVLRKTIRSNDR